ncbi:MAG: hypothetical protein K2J93_03585 [Anaeroplasmataceae bacterium]|nr:hypothetical protein [Anaeroplasmataceae bacterium]
MKQEFLNNIHRGLGRAVLELKQAQNKTEYLETVLYACLSDSSYEYIVEGPKSNFLYQLIKLFNLKEIELIKHSIINSLTDKDSVSLLFQKLELLYEFYIDAHSSIKPVLESFYEEFIKNTKRWTKKRIMAYEILIITMDKIFGLSKTLKIIDYIEEKKINKEYLGWYESRLKEKYKKNKIIQSFGNMQNLVRKDVCLYTLEEFKSHYKEPLYKAVFGDRVSLEEFEKCVDYISKTEDIECICALLETFSYDDSLYKFPEEILFQLLSTYGKPVQKYVYDSLKYYKSEQVLALGLKLIKAKKFLEQGIVMLFTNYESKYKEILISAYKKVQFSFNSKIYSSITYDTISFMKHKRRDYPDEILFINYSKSYSSFERENIFDIIKKRGLLTKEILEECCYDFSYEISTKANQLLRLLNS